MLLAVDIGNSNIVLGFLEGSQVSASYRIATTTAHTTDEYGVMIRQFLTLRGFAPDDVEAGIIASVVPNVTLSFATAIRTYLGVDPMIISTQLDSGVSIGIGEPASLGVDCLADCAGAFATYGGPVLVADFGTATTCNFVDGTGRILSGLITTGIRTTALALTKETAQLPEVEIARPDTIMATDTISAMQAGLYFSAIGGIERILTEFARTIGTTYQVVATGGLGGIVAEGTELIDVYDPDLMFKGMRVIYERNR